MKKMLGFVVLSLVLCIMLCGTEDRSHAGETLKVPDTYSTIQAAIDAASNGDTVLVADGTYTGEGNRNIEFDGKAITVKSENGPDNCIIDCEDTEYKRGVYFHDSEGSDSVLDGFTIKRAKYTASDGGGIRISYASPTIKNCIIEDCYARKGAGICCWFGHSHPTIENCIIRNNTAVYKGAGIYMDYSHPTITNCVIENNTSTNYDGGGICAYWSEPVLDRCVISGNTSKYNGGALWFYGTLSKPKFRNCLIKDNTTTHSTMGNGGALYAMYNAECTFTNCTIVANESASYGGGIYCYNTAEVILENTILWDNNSVRGKGHQIYEYSGGTVTASYCDYKNTYPDTYGYITSDNCINSDPLFVGDGDYHIKADSPCIDVGDNNEATGDHDWDGNARILDGDKDETDTVDIGFYEAHPDWSPNAVVSDTPELDFIAPVPAGFDDAGSFFAYSKANDTLYYYEKIQDGWDDPETVDSNLPNVIQIAVGDGNNDDLADVYALAPEDANLYWYENISQSFAQHYVVYMCASGIDRMEPFDFNGDGYWEVFVHDSDTFTVCSNSAGATPSYSKEVLFAGDVSEGTLLFAAGDINSDDQVDIICARPGGELFALRNVLDEGEHYLDPHMLSYNIPEGLTGVTVLDYDGNSYADIGLTVEASPATLTVYTNDGGMTLTPTTNSLGVAHSLALTPVKLDSDVMPDMMSLDASRKRISWYRNASSHSPQPESAALAYVANTVEPTYT